MSRVHVIGAGLAGLAAATRLAADGHVVTLHEATGQAGGRCRSFFDETLGCTIDNGNHLLLSGNRAAFDYLGLIGARDSLAGPAEARFPFLDLESGERWDVRPNKGPLPWWIFAAGRRVAATRARDYAAVVRLFSAPRDATVADCLPTEGPLYRRFIEPLTVAVLNAPPNEAAAKLLLPVFLETFARGEAFCRPRIARLGLSESLVAPALPFLVSKGGEIRFGSRLTGLDIVERRVEALVFARGREPLGREDAVIVALPPWVLGDILPRLPLPQGAHPIVNVHYRLTTATSAEPSLIGLVGGTAHWVFRRGDIASVTVSAATDLVDVPATQIAERCWTDVAHALGLTGDVPPNRVVKERRATFAQIPSALSLRAHPLTDTDNLFLAGDWTDTGLPATIEGAIRSGVRAAVLTAQRQAGGGRGTNSPARQAASF